MSQKLINHSLDLKKLRDEGYEIEIRNGHLLINSVPYLNSNKEIQRGTIVSELTIAGDKTGNPSTHVVHFIGEHPCNKDGTIIKQIQHSSSITKLAEGIVVNHSFSNKPQNGYSNYYEKMNRYIEIITAPVLSIDSKITAKTFKTVEAEESESVFNYVDTNSSRAGIGVISEKLKNQKIGIIGLGGTGSYVLDFVSKTMVQEIHLFDGDKFFQHNAFRAPGAPSVQDLNETPYKPEYFKAIYSRMHKNIIAHCEYIDESNITLIKDLDFVFICLDKSYIKKALSNKLEEFVLPFIDVGMGIETLDDSLIGIIRVTLSTPIKRDHILENKRISLSDDDDENIYSQNIQIAELNALNATLAVIKWKKLFGIYQDLEKEFNSTYTINVNMLLSEDNAA